MAKNKEKFMQSSRSSWLKLSPELVAVFVGISAGFFVNNALISTLALVR